MTWKIFAELVELKAKTASVFPFLVGLAYAWYHYRLVDGVNMGLFFVAMFLFNMAVDMWDNYMDYHRATDKHDYKEKTNIIGREHLSLRLIRMLMIGFTVTAAVIGLVLVYRTGWFLLFLGLISFGVGILYAGGPKPLSSLPVGELASGGVMGFVIPLICVYLNVAGEVPITGKFVGEVFLVSLPLVFAIGNLMLANNTCDLEEDLLNNRRTLASYLGQRGAVRLFQFGAAAPFICLTGNVIIGLAPVWVLGTWLAAPKIYQQTKAFSKEQNKQTTFIYGVKNLAITSALYAVCFVIGSALA